MFGALSTLIIIRISCDSAGKEKEANIVSIQLNDSAVFGNKSHSVKWFLHMIRFRVCFVQVDNELGVLFFFFQWLIATHGSCRYYRVQTQIQFFQK